MVECNIIGTSGISEYQQQLNNFWPKALEDTKNLKPNDFKTQELPLARIKKIMKLDEDVKMISAEAPALFAKAAELFISELTLRAWVHAEENKRRTLQRNDIAVAISRHDQFDFLIDIVPREEIRTPKRNDDGVIRTIMNTDQVQYFFQMPQSQTATVQHASAASTTAQIQLQAPVLQQPIQIVTGNTAGSAQVMPTLVTQGDGGQSQIIQLQAVGQQQQQHQSVAAAAPAAPTAAGGQSQIMQVYTQVVTANGDVQHIPIQLTPSQIQAITQQMQGKQPNQPIVIHTSLDQSSNDSTMYQMFGQHDSQDDVEHGDVS